MAAGVTLRYGDNLDVLREVPDNTFDACVTDPPYGLSEHDTAAVTACLQAWLAGEPYRPNKRGFMGKTWDAWVPGPEVWREVYRVLKPGAHLLVFAGTRSHDLMGIAVRLAGFETRDTAAWLYGMGFPKGIDISKAIDAMAGAQREVVGVKRANGIVAGRMRSSNLIDRGDGKTPDGRDLATAKKYVSERKEGAIAISVPGTPDAERWAGWNTALKPAFEPVLIFRKPLSESTVAKNVLRWGTGAINVDGCRVKMKTGDQKGWFGPHAPEHLQRRTTDGIYGDGFVRNDADQSTGRWPANVIHDGSEEVTALFPATTQVDHRDRKMQFQRPGANGIYGNFAGINSTVAYSDTGSAARFFYAAKASQADRDAGLDPVRWLRGNYHVSVKPTSLMRWLCRLVTPPGGVVLDPFCGSGSTGKGAVMEGFGFFGIDNDPQHPDIIELAKARIEAALLPMDEIEVDAGAQSTAPSEPASVQIGLGLE
jgi:DNA modification methylase